MVSTIEHGSAGQVWRISRRALGLGRREGNGGGTARHVLTLLIAIAIYLIPSLAAAESVKEVRRVLVFNLLNPLSSPGIAVINQSIVAGLGKAPYQIELYSEDLEVALFPDEASQRRIRQWYIRKYHDRRPDVIIAVGPDPIKFMLESHERFFPGIPIILCGSPGEIGEWKRDSQFTGVWAALQPEKTLEVALRLQPRTKHVVVVGGVGAYDRNLQAIARCAFRKYESRLDFTFLTDLDMPTLLERLKHLPDNTIVYHTAMSQDASGTRFIDATQSVPMIASAANAPVFVVDDVDVGRGTVGGYVWSLATEGQVAAGMAVRVLNGEKPEDIPIGKGTNVYLFDWRAMQRWGLKESDLPPGSVVLNRQPSVWELYKWYIIGGISLIGLESLLIFGLVWQRSARHRAETDLALAHNRLRLAVEAGNCVVWEWDVKRGQDRRFGDLQTMFGIPSDTFSGKVEDFRRYVHPEDRELVWKAETDARQDRQPYVAEFRVVRDDGAVRWVRARGNFTYANNGDAERMLGMAVDITERKQAEERLRKSEEKFAKAFRESPVALTLTSTKDHRYLDINETFERITGWRREEVIGRTPLDLGIWVDPAQRLEFVKRLQAEGTIRNFEVRFRCKDGTHRVGLGSAELIEIEGEPCALAVIEDITEREHTQEKLHQSEEQLHQIIASAMDAIIAVDEEQRIVLFNASAEKMFGYPAHEAIGTTIDHLIPERFRKEHGAHMSLFGESGVTSRTMGVLNTLCGVRASGEEFPIEASISHTDTDGKKLFTVILRDMTERRRMEEAQRQSEERLHLAVHAGRMYAYEWDAASDMIFRSPEYVDILGISQPAQISRRELLAQVHPDDRERLEALFTGISPESPTSQICYRLLLPDGSVTWLEKRARAFFDDKGRLLRTVGVVADVTDRKHAEEALRESEDRFRRVVEHIRDAVIVDDVAGHVVFANDRFLRLFGFRRDQLRTLKMEDYIAPEYRAELRDRHDRRMRGEEVSTHFEYEGMGAGGNRMWLEVDVVPITNEAGKLVGTQSAIRDITQRKQAEAALLMSEERYRHLINSANDWVWEVDADGVYTYAGPQCREILGYEPAELVGKTPFDLMPPDESLRVASTFHRIAAERKAFRALENVNIHKDGHLVVLETNGAPIIDEDGKFRGYRGMDRDISERKRAERTLRESEERFRLVANTAPVMIWMSGPDKLCTYFNQPWLNFTGRPLEAELGNGWAEGVHPEDWNACLNTYTQAFDRRESFKMQYRLRRHDGEYRWMSDRGVPRFNSDGSLAGYIGSCTDITDAKLAEDALANIGRRLIEAHEEERTWIARELHDDINQRIALLTIELEQFKDRLPYSAEIELHRQVDHARQRLFDLAKDIQALSHRLHSSKLEYLGIAAAANSFCKELSEQKKVLVEFSHSKIPSTLPAEVSLCLFRVLQEALQNAVKHSGARHFKVELRGTSEEITLTVNDPGVGFDWRDTMKQQGLGLISMKERVQLVKGEFSVKSEPGRGTTVYVRVPLSSEERSLSATG